MNWFTADTHFCHVNIIRYCQRPFADVQAMDEELVRRWNACVEAGDTVYHLGDVALGSRHRQRDIIGRLNGRKLLIVGSHDPSPDFLKRCGFVEYHYDLVVTIAGTPVYLRHEPPPLESLPRPCVFCLHGHIHRLPGQHPFLNVGVDRFDFRPVSEEEVAKLLGM